MSVRAALVVACTLLMQPGASRATTFVTMSDADLVRSSSAVVVGTVHAIATSAATTGAIETRIKLRVEEQLKGRRRRALIFNIPGGAAQGVRRVVFGVPQFFVGERVLVFLRARPDGALTLTALSMGKFTLIDAPNGARAHRQLAGALAFDVHDGQLVEAPPENDRPLAAFLDALRGMGTQPPSAGIPVSPATTRPAAATRWGDAFTFIGSPPVRWSQPDAGEPVSYLVDPNGDATIGSAASHSAFDQALAAWSNAGASVRLVDAGAATPAPFSACDGISTVQFNDPFGEIGSPSNCAGVLAVGGYCSTKTNPTTVHGVTFDGITEGDITVNGGLAGCAYWTATNLAEVLTHELGHTLGLGHSSESPQEPNPEWRDATMYYLAHFDGRGAAVRSDDVAGIQALYPATVSAQSRFQPLQLRVFTLDPSATALVINVMIRFPAARFTPLRDGIGISVSDSSGLLYSGTAPRLTVRPRNRGPAGYVGALTGVSGYGSVTFSWLHGTNASLVVRISSPTLIAPAGNQAALSLSFGSETFTTQVALQPAEGGEWVLE